MGTLTLQDFLDSEFGESVKKVVLPEKLSPKDIQTPEDVVIRSELFGNKSENAQLRIVRTKIHEFFSIVEGARVLDCKSDDARDSISGVHVVTRCGAAFSVTITHFHDRICIRVTDALAKR